MAPQTFPEDLGLSPIEARSCGVPSIVSRAGGLPEAGGISALLAEAGDVLSLRAALEKAAAMDPAEYSRLAFECRETLRAYLAQPGFYVRQFHSLLAR